MRCRMNKVHGPTGWNPDAGDVGGRGGGGEKGSELLLEWESNGNLVAKASHDYDYDDDDDEGPSGRLLLPPLPPFSCAGSQRRLRQSAPVCTTEDDGDGRRPRCRGLAVLRYRNKARRRSVGGGRGRLRLPGGAPRALLLLTFGYSLLLLPRSPSSLCRPPLRGLPEPPGGGGEGRRPFLLRTAVATVEGKKTQVADYLPGSREGKEGREEEGGREEQTIRRRRRRELPPLPSKRRIAPPKTVRTELPPLLLCYGVMAVFLCLLTSWWC